MLFSVTENTGSRGNTLSIIVPIARMAGKLQYLKTWISSSVGTDSIIVLVHDIQDFDTGIELREFIDSIDSKQVVFVEKFFGSPGLARNAGLEKVVTEWCCFWDSDDIPNLEVTLSNIHNAKLDTDVIISNFKSKGTGEATTIDHHSNLDYVAMNPGIWRMVFKTEVIKQHKFLDLRMGEDQIFLLDVDLSNLKIEFSKKVSYVYCTEQEGQLTNQPELNSLRAMSIIQQSVKDSSYKFNEFLTIVYMRLFLSSLKRLGFKYPFYELLKNFIFISKLRPKSVFFFIKYLFFHNEFFHKTSRDL